MKKGFFPAVLLVGGVGAQLTFRAEKPLHLTDHSDEVAFVISADSRNKCHARAEMTGAHNLPDFLKKAELDVRVDISCPNTRERKKGVLSQFRADSQYWVDNTPVRNRRLAELLLPTVAISLSIYCRELLGVTMESEPDESLDKIFEVKSVEEFKNLKHKHLGDKVEEKSEAICVRESKACFKEETHSVDTVVAVEVDNEDEAMW